VKTLFLFIVLSLPVYAQETTALYCQTQDIDSLVLANVRGSNFTTRAIFIIDSAWAWADTLELKLNGKSLYKSAYLDRTEKTIVDITLAEFVEQNYVIRWTDPAPIPIGAVKLILETRSVLLLDRVYTGATYQKIDLDLQQ
jgi:hypothetical protein